MSNFSRKSKAGFGLAVFIAILLIVGSFIFIKYRGVSASERTARGKVSWQTKLAEDINGDGKVEEIYLTSYNNGNTKSSVISARVNLFQSREKDLAGFEEDLAFCPNKKYFKMADGDTALCLFGEVGVHSENIQIIRLRDFLTVEFIDARGNHRQNMTSDVPYFDFNFAGLENFKIFFDNRDYDKNPLVDSIRTGYYLDNNAFRYNGSENLTLEGAIK